MVNGKDDEPTKSKRDRFLNTNKNAPLPDRLHSTAVASFKSKTLTIKKNFDLIQLNVPKGQDYFWGIRNNIQSETCARGVASVTANKYICHAKGQGKEILKSVFDEESMIFAKEENNKKFEKDEQFHKELHQNQALQNNTPVYYLSLIHI